MTRAVDKFTMPKRYDLISSVIRNNILSGRLPPGFVLLEGPIANLTQSSRAPVQAALRILEKERLVRRFQGRGYLVARDGEQVEPLRRDIREIDLQISGEIDEALQNRGLWEMVYDTVEDAVASCLIFGEFRIIETETRRPSRRQPHRRARRAEPAPRARPHPPRTRAPTGSPVR